jgi:alpha-glucosidase
MKLEIASRLAVRLFGCLGLMLASPALGLAATNSWSLACPNGQCVLAVSLDRGELSYQASRNGKPVILKSPLGLRRNDQDFECGLVFETATEPENRLERYELFAGPHPQVSKVLSHRLLKFRNSSGAPLEIDLAASDEAVGFRYRFPETNQLVRVIQSERTGFNLPRSARGWLQPYHAASQYTPAYEDFYFHLSPGVPPPNSRQKAVGWTFPALFHISAAATWVLLTTPLENSTRWHHALPARGGFILRLDQ